MWIWVIFAVVIGSCVEAQNGRSDHGHGWDIRLAVPGEPGSDYPTLGSIPRTSFSCAGKEPGYYADAEAGCQVFRICTVGSTYGFQSFLCPNGTLFNQEVFVCDWWMNVKCQSSQQLLSAQNAMFGNLRLGPQLMKDIKKMLTHPMRNPYDKTAMKSNFIVMQDYKPPAGQLFPNSALIAGPERTPNNIYLPAKQIQQSFQSYDPNNIVFAASTLDTRYIPAGFTNRPLKEDAEVFPKQRQGAQYVQNSNVQTTKHSGIGSFVANGHALQFPQNRVNEQFNNVPRPRQNQNFNQPNVQYTQTLGTNSLATQTQSIPREQLNRQRDQYTDIEKPTQAYGGKQNKIVPYTTQQYNQEKQPYTYRPPNIPFPSDPNSNGNNEVMQNLGLVFSFLADSLNAAKEYSNLANQDVLYSSTPAPEFQNLNNEDLSQITNKVSQLTSSHFYGNSFNAANIAQTRTQSTSITQLNQGNSNMEANQQTQAQRLGSAQYNTAPSSQSQRQLLTQFQADNNILNKNLLDPSQNQIYSGQLYQLPVPEVTNYIYNKPQSGNIIHTNLEQDTQTVSTSQTTNQNNNVAARNNLLKQSSAEVEIVRSQTLPVSPAKLRLEPTNEPESFYSQESLNSLLNSVNGISAQLQDKIVGIIPHQLEDNKLMTYEKDQSYYLYTKFDKSGQNVPLNAINKVTNIPNVITFQFVPSVSYSLEDKKEQQKPINSFNIDNFGAPRNAGGANLVQVPNQQHGILTSSVNYNVEHPSSAKQVQLDPISALYRGPSSYSAPQGSIGSLSRQTLPPPFSSRLEQPKGNAEGYPKSTPSHRFIF